MSCGHGCGCHGAAKPHGSGHWLAERLTAIALAPLGLWLVWSAVMLRGASYARFTDWLNEPLHAGLLSAFIVIATWHGIMGCQVIIDDYIRPGWFHTMKTIGVKVFYTALAALSLLAIYSIVL